MRTEHILIYRFSAMGDVAMLVPVVSSLATQYPDLRITVLSKPFAKPFFENLAPNVGFMSADLKKEYKGLGGLNELYRRLSAKHFTCVADMHDVLRTKYLRLLFMINGYKVQHIDKHRSEKRRLTRSINKIRKQLSTSFQNYADVLARLGYPVELKFNSIFPPSGGDLTLLPEMFRNKPAGEKWIGVAPFAAHKAKIYPVEKLRESLLLTVGKKSESRFFFFCGSKEEHAIVDEMCSVIPNSVNASAQLKGLDQELVLMSHLDLMVSMDSANMHLASMVGTRVLSIWGATSPLAGFLGWNQQQTIVAEPALECHPCSIYGDRPCRRKDQPYACLAHTPENVCEYILRLLDK